MTFSFDIVVKFWFYLGLIFIVLEVVVPGGVISFLGISALITALLTSTGVIASISDSILLWFLLSLFCILALRSLLQKFLPGNETFEEYDEIKDALGEEVEVLSERLNEGDIGRIKYRGAGWNAILKKGDLVKGEKAKIVGRENLNWLIEKC